MSEEREWVRCSCCGQDIPDDAEHNADFIPDGSTESNPHDTGYGMCVDCGGDRHAGEETPEKPLTEAQYKRRLGWAGRMFFEARFDVIEKHLHGPTLEKFRAFSYAKKCAMVSKAVQRGLMI